MCSVYRNHFSIDHQHSHTPQPMVTTVIVLPSKNTQYPLILFYWIFIAYNFCPQTCHVNQSVTIVHKVSYSQTIQKYNNSALTPTFITGIKVSTFIYLKYEGDTLWTVLVSSKNTLSGL